LSLIVECICDHNLLVIITKTQQSDGCQATNSGDCGRIYTLYTTLNDLRVTTVQNRRKKENGETKIDYIIRNKLNPLQTATGAYPAFYLLDT
jgi:hypothetical protein